MIYGAGVDSVLDVAKNSVEGKLFYPCKKNDCLHYGPMATGIFKKSSGVIRKTVIKFRVFYAASKTAIACLECSHFKKPSRYLKK